MYSDIISIFVDVSHRKSMKNNILILVRVVYEYYGNNPSSIFSHQMQREIVEVLKKTFSEG